MDFFNQFFCDRRLLNVNVERIVVINGITYQFIALFRCGFIISRCIANHQHIFRLITCAFCKKQLLLFAAEFLPCHKIHFGQQTVSIQSSLSPFDKAADTTIASAEERMRCNASDRFSNGLRFLILSQKSRSLNSLHAITLSRKSDGILRQSRIRKQTARIDILSEILQAFYSASSSKFINSLGKRLIPLFIEYGLILSSISANLLAVFLSNFQPLTATGTNDYVCLIFIESNTVPSESIPTKNPLLFCMS